jgi:general secretion pathway protein K
MEKLKKYMSLFAMVLCLAVALTGCREDSMTMVSSESYGTKSSEGTKKAESTDGMQLTDEADLTELSETASDKDASETTARADENTQKTICVFVCGEVQQEGVYELPEDARVNDALQMAGGFSEDASKDAVNLAEHVVDGQRIYFPSAEEVENRTWDAETAQLDSDVSSQAEQVHKININTADKEELITLSGIGEAKADAVIAYREEHGSFQNIDEIMNVSGIGENLFEKIKEKICVEE